MYCTQAADKHSYFIDLYKQKLLLNKCGNIHEKKHGLRTGSGLATDNGKQPCVKTYV
jgi:hypothetical protein